MKIRVSISNLMLSAAWIALDCGALRATIGTGPPYVGLVLFCVLPMANIWFAALLLARSGARRGVPRPFATGFATAGGVGFALFVACILAFPNVVGRAAVAPIQPFYPLIESNLTARIVLIALGGLWCQVPVLVPGLVGGYLWWRWQATASSAIPYPHRSRDVDSPEAGGTRLAEFGRQG